MAGLVMGAASGPAKLKAVTELVNQLNADLGDDSMAPTARNQALEQLKIYGRDPNNADPIFTKRGISMLLRHAFHSSSSETARAALRVLANSMLLKPETRQMFVEGGFAPRACTSLKSDQWDDEFLISRVIFLSTYGTQIDLKAMIDQHQLADNIVHNLERHAKLLSGKAKANTEPMEEMALLETLKLLFNVTHFCKDRVSSFAPSIPLIFALFWRQDIPSSKPLDSAFGQLSNALLNLDTTTDEAQSTVFPKDEPAKLPSKLIDLLELSMRSYGDNDLESVVTPLVSLLKKIYETAPAEVREHMKERLLPSAADRNSVLGQGDTLSAKLLKNSTHPTAPSLRDATSHLLFDMSERDASKFVENVGYGIASGFLFQNNVPIPESASKGVSSEDTSGQQKPVNPITGQFLDTEKFADAPEMTEEEKEREAERLFVLFERLKKNGIIDVQNPVEAAIQQGKFQDLDDREVEELD